MTKGEDISKDPKVQDETEELKNKVIMLTEELRRTKDQTIVEQTIEIEKLFG